MGFDKHSDGSERQGGSGRQVLELEKENLPKGTAIMQMAFEGDVELKSVSVDASSIEHFIVNRIEYSTRTATPEEQASFRQLEKTIHDNAVEFHVEHGHIWCTACDRCLCQARDMRDTAPAGVAAFTCEACKQHLETVKADPVIPKEAWEQFRGKQMAMREPWREIADRTRGAAYAAASETRDEMVATFGEGRSCLLTGRVPKGLPITFVVTNTSQDEQTFRGTLAVEMT